MSYLAITAILSFAAGWVVHHARTRARMRALVADCEGKIQASEEHLALERLRLEQRMQEALGEGDRADEPPSTLFAAYRDAQLARPRSAAADSSTSRA